MSSVFGLTFISLTPFPSSLPFHQSTDSCIHSACNAYTVRGHFVTMLHSRNTWERSFTRESTQRTEPMTNSMWSTTWSLARVGKRFSQRTTEKSLTKMTSKPLYWISVFSLCSINCYTGTLLPGPQHIIEAVSSFSQERHILHHKFISFDSDWNGWEEAQLVPVVCLFCKFSATDIGVVLQHMKVPTSNLTLTLNVCTLMTVFKL